MSSFVVGAVIPHYANMVQVHQETFIELEENIELEVSTIMIDKDTKMIQYDCYLLKRLA